MTTDEERTKVRRWAETVDQASMAAATARVAVGRDAQTPAAASAYALVSIALSLSVIAEVVAATLADDVADQDRSGR